MHRVLLVLVPLAALAFAVTGCAGEPTAEDRFVSVVLGTPGYHGHVPREELVRLGHVACDRLDRPVTIPLDVSFDVSWATSGLGLLDAITVTTAANANLCPAKTYLTATTSAVRMSSTPPAAARPAAVTITGDVGNEPVGENIQPGRYTTQGGDTCYWAVITKDRDGEVADIRNRLGGGSQTVTLKVGQDFQSLRCGTWTKAG